MNNKNNKLRGYLRPEADEAQIEAWGWPEMETEAEVETNALGLAPDWYHQEQAPELPPDAPVEEPAPSITAEEVEAIRQAAWEEGMREGREAGFAKGLEEGKLEGLQQGHQAGLEQGREEGLALGRDQVEQEVARWQALATRLATPLSELDGAVEQQLITLVQQLARALIRHEAQTSPTLLLEALKQGLALLPAAEQGVTLMLHPDDVTRVEQAFGAEECVRRHWRLQSDPTLSPGDLQLATELSSIDLTLSGRIDQLLRNFLRDNAG
ncbi:flagellar assembly protein FliH [Aeromonas sanarellii]|uniref:Flagellar assembly protein FliH n=1 Tax=Aeromonas sanarellii TaxID=633415 RepID=A0ABS4B4E9_9GAMM|nr:flagellar assembly protein FliH [Aeromonas sanarellii]MBP0602357.1 flagellar assembly protein FliH [Aeromonas sanarellii]